MLKNIENIIFDLDGTLIDSSGDIIECLKEAYKVVLDKNIIIEKKFIGPPLKEMIKLASPNITEEQLNLLIKIFRTKYFNINYEKTLLYKNVKEFIYSLKDKNIFLATNKPFIPTQKILKKFLVYKNFKDIITPDILEGKEVNKTTMICFLIKTYNLDKNKTLMIGDTVSDIIASHKNSIKILCVLHGYGLKKELQEAGADYMIKGFKVANMFNKERLCKNH